MAEGKSYQKKKIEILHISDSLVYLGKGIDEDDSVISEGAGFLEPDMEIEIVE